MPLAIALACRLVLAAVFAIAALAKLVDRDGARRAARDFGAPERLAGPLAVVIPLAELAVAALLVPAGTAVWGSIGALVLLGVFSAAIAVAMARGRAPDCHCFGQLHSEPAGWKTLARNAVLGAAAALVVAEGGGPSATAWFDDLRGAEIVALAVGVAAVALLAVGGYLLLHLLRSYGRVLVRLDRLERMLVEAGFDLHEHEEMPEIGLQPGTPAPAFSLENVLGDTVTLEGLLEPDRPILLLFTSPSCGPCKLLLPTVTRWQRELAASLTIAVVSSGDRDAIRAEAEAHALARVLVDGELDVYRAYEANGTPSAVLVTPDGEIGSWVASGGDWVEHLVERTVGGNIEPEDEGLQVGAPVPSVALPSLDGEVVSLDALTAPSVVLFWNPYCGFCRRMHQDLLAWERSRNGSSPELLVVTSAAEEEAADDGFASTVLLDAEYAAMSAFRAGGTPSAVLLDGAGQVASPIAVGADGVLSLLAGDRVA